MKNRFKYSVIVAAAVATFAACDKWTETEPVDVVYETLESKNPTLWAKYLASLRDYHMTDHQVLIAKFDNKATTPAGRGDHINCLPDSVDYVVLNNMETISDAMASEMAEIRGQKGIRTLATLDLSAIEKAFDQMIADELEAYWEQDGADYDGRPQPTPERFQAFTSEKIADALSTVEEYDFDGVLVIFSAKNPASLSATALEDAVMRQTALLAPVESWLSSHDGALLFFEGTPAYIAIETGLLQRAKYIIIPSEDASNDYTLTYNVMQSLGSGVPADRFVAGVTAVDITDLTNTNGSFGSTSAIVGAAAWNVTGASGFTKKGVCVNHAQFDYYDITNVYSQINKAISIMNPSPVK